MNHIEQRQKMKRLKPDFFRQDAHKKVKVHFKWRKPKGIDSKMRLGKRGYRRCRAIGWGSPRDVKGLHSSGLTRTIIHNIKELENLDPKKDGVLIANSVGNKNRVQIVQNSVKKGLRVLNVKNTDQFLKAVEESLKTRKSKRASLRDQKEKEAKKKEEPKDAKKGKLEDKVQTEEEKKEEEKKEKDRLLTKKQGQ